MKQKRLVQRRYVTRSYIEEAKMGVLDSVKSAQSQYDGDHRHMPLLMQAEHDWQMMRNWRTERERCKKFYFGDQWGDTVHVNNKDMSMEDYLKKQGAIPLKTNMIRRLGNSVTGVQIGQHMSPTCIARDRDEQKLGEMMSTALEFVRTNNDMTMLENEQFQEFLISGLAGPSRKRFGWKDTEYDVWTEAMDQRYFFVDSNMKDPRHKDVRRLGYLHDYTWGELCHEFASGAEMMSMMRKLKEIYKVAMNREELFRCCEEFGHKRLNSINFLVPNDGTLYRVIEVWTKETKKRYRCHDEATGETWKREWDDIVEDEEENASRISMAAEEGIDPEDVALITTEPFVDSYWYCRWITPTGEVLREYESPFDHKEHPFVFMFYPFVDGEVHSFVGDVIDQQVYVNRLITMYDFIIRSSAKGVLLVPEECIPDNMDINEFSDAWAKFNGVLMIKEGANKLPQQVAQNATNIGIPELLNMQLKFFEDISGVHGALQGATPQSGTSGKLYEQQMANGATALLPLLESFNWYIKESARKDVWNIQQCYDNNRMISIAGKSVYYDAYKIRDVRFDLKIAESTNTATFRQKADEMLQMLFDRQVINAEQLLKHSSYPFADALLQDITAMQQQMQEQQQGGIGNAPQRQIDPALMQQVKQTADMDAVAKAKEQLQRVV